MSMQKLASRVTLSLLSAFNLATAPNAQAIDCAFQTTPISDCIAFHS